MCQNLPETIEIVLAEVAVVDRSPPALRIIAGRGIKAFGPTRITLTELCAGTGVTSVRLERWLE